MKSLGIIGVLAITIVSILFVVWLGNRAFSSLRNPSPVISSTLPANPPKIVDTGKQIVIFENPLINEPGLSVSELLKRTDELKGRAVEVKGIIRNRDGDWGFWLNETNGERQQVFILTHPSLTKDEVSSYSIVGKRYIRVRGVLKDVIWTNEESVEDATTSAQAVFSPPQRLSIIPDEIIEINLP
jgi:hypothetical protein